MSTDKNFSTSENNDPQPPVEKQSASNNPENSQQEPKYTQLYGLEGTDGKMSLDPQASPGFQGAEGKEEPHKRISKQFDIDPNTREPLLIAQTIRNILIIIPALIILVVFIGGLFNIGMARGLDDVSQVVIMIAVIIVLPYIIHVILQIVAFARFRKSVRFRWIRGVNIYSLIVAPISEVTCVPFMLGCILVLLMGCDRPSAVISSMVAGVMAALYEITLGISMIVVTTNSIKKTTQTSEQKQHEISEGKPDESL